MKTKFAVEVVTAPDWTRWPEDAISAPQPDSRVIDWNNSSDHKWLMSHMTWAIHNHHYVTLRHSGIRLIPA